MIILGIETVTKVGTIAIVKDGGILAQTTIDTNLKHTSRFVPALSNLLTTLNLNVADIDSIVLDVGPGSFTGIRVGIASAKGLAVKDNKPILGVCSLDVLAYQVKDIRKEKYFIPLIDAKRGSVYSACYEFNKNGINIIKQPYVVPFEAFLKNIPENSFVFGPDMKKYFGIIRQKDSAYIDRHATYPYAGIVAQLAYEKNKVGILQNTIEPIYIHDIEYKEVQRSPAIAGSRNINFKTDVREKFIRRGGQS